MIELMQLLTLLRQMEQIEGLSAWAERLPQQLKHVFGQETHGDLDKWHQVINAIRALPKIPVETVDLRQSPVSAGTATTPSDPDAEKLQQLMMALHPWRKGPFQIQGMRIDTEWRSDWKWDRLMPHISPLKDRAVLDVGCGNGYHCWRMLGEEAALVMGIDPTQIYLAQFLALKHFLGPDAPVYHLPLGIEDLPPRLRAFDTVFSMGVLYHRRAPIDHLIELREALVTGGELVLETLILEGEGSDVLTPRGRYAKMRNVWFIPTISVLQRWLARAGFRDIRAVDVTVTSLEEQRSTDWMHFESLKDFLDPLDHTKTIEGDPAPVRAMVIARA